MLENYIEDSDDSIADKNFVPNFEEADEFSDDNDSHSSPHKLSKRRRVVEDIADLPDADEVDKSDQTNNDALLAVVEGNNIAFYS